MSKSGNFRTKLTDHDTDIISDEPLVVETSMEDVKTTEEDDKTEENKRYPS